MLAKVQINQKVKLV